MFKKKINQRLLYPCYTQAAAKADAHAPIHQTGCDLEFISCHTLSHILKIPKVLTSVKTLPPATHRLQQKLMSMPQSIRQVVIVSSQPVLCPNVPVTDAAMRFLPGVWGWGVGEHAYTDARVWAYVTPHLFVMADPVSYQTGRRELSLPAGRHRLLCCKTHCRKTLHFDAHRSW